jgi:hypothetical protein
MNPSHVNGILSKPSIVAAVNGRFGVYSLDETFLQLQCLCGAGEFAIMISRYPEAKCLCINCGQEIKVYDISLYPSGAGYDAERGNFSPWQGSENTKATAYKVFVSYEYPEDAENEDDISWFIMVAQDPLNGLLQEVMNDETA